MGRPKNAEPTVPIAVRVPTAMMLSIDLDCRNDSMSRSAWLKSAISEKLGRRASQVVPAKREDNRVYVQLTPGEWTCVDDLPTANV